MKINIKDLKILLFLFKPYKIECSIVLFIMVISGFLEAVNVAAIYPIINHGLNLETKGKLLGSLDYVIKFISSENPFLASCIFLLIISIFSLIFKIAFNYLSNKLLVKISGNIQKDVFQKFVAADYAFYVKNQQGKLIYGGTTASQQTFVVVMYGITAVYYLINILFLFSLIVLLSWKGTVLILLLGFFYSVVIRKLTRKFVRKCSAVCVEESQARNVFLNEFITGIKAIKIFQSANDWEKKYYRSVDRFFNNRFRTLFWISFPEVLVKFIFFLFLSLVGIFLSQTTSSEDIFLFLPALGTFVLVAYRLLPFINAIGYNIMEITKSIPDARIVHDICTEKTVFVVDGKKNFEVFENKIVFENVCFKYENMDDYLLKNLSFSIEKNNMTALVGFSGSGKTTIINLLLKLYQVDKGAIKIDGENILEFSNSSYLRKIGYVSQETFIFNASFKENIRFGMENCTDEMIKEAAKLANADDFIEDTPEGYNTIVGDSGIKLSGGQKQRVAIARAMLRKPEIIIFDEATSSLDNISERKIQNAINNISKHTTVLVVAHRLSTVENADKIIILDKGEIKDQGTHEELLENKGLYYNLYMSKDNANNEEFEEKNV